MKIFEYEEDAPSDSDNMEFYQPSSVEELNEMAALWEAEDTLGSLEQ